MLQGPQWPHHSPSPAPWSWSCAPCWSPILPCRCSRVRGCAVELSKKNSQQPQVSLSKGFSKGLDHFPGSVLQPSPTHCGTSWSCSNGGLAPHQRVLAPAVLLHGATPRNTLSPCSQQKQLQVTHILKSVRKACRLELLNMLYPGLWQITGGTIKPYPTHQGLSSFISNMHFRVLRLCCFLTSWDLHEKSLWTCCKSTSTGVSFHCISVIKYIYTLIYILFGDAEWTIGL